MTGIQPLFARSIDDIVALLPELDEHFRSPDGLIAPGAQSFNPYWNPQPRLEIIPLRRQPGSRASDIQNQLAVVATRYTVYLPLSDAAEELCARLQGRMARVFLARLPAGREMPGQIEAGIYERAVERFILPITHGGIKFEDDRHEDPYFLPAIGTWYAIDAHRHHLIRSTVHDPFIFLVVDTFPEQGEVASGIDYDNLCPRAFG